MIANQRVSFVLIVATLAVSLVIMMLPLPGSIAPFRPAVYAMTVLFWVVHQPHRFGLIAAWIAGVMFDALYGTPLAEHGLALAIASYALLKVRHWLWGMPLIQQFVLVGPAIAVYEFVLFWVDGVAGLDVDPWWRWLPVVSSALIWPIWSYLLERIAEFEVE